jgi:hypothetical protein
MNENLKNIINERAKSLFLAKIDESIKNNESYKERYLVLKNHFIDKVSIMHTPETYAASRIAEACISVVTEKIMQEKLIEFAIERYNEIPISVNTTTKTIENDELTQQLQSEIIKNDVSLNEDDHETIELIHSFKKDELKLEGKRIRGYLPSNFDSTVHEEEDCEINIEEETLSVQCFYDDNSEMIYCCPQCKSPYLIIESDRGSCSDCDCEFNMNMSLGDALPEIDEGNINSSIVDGYGREINRSSGEKKNRGSVIFSPDEFLHG